MRITSSFNVLLILTVLLAATGCNFPGSQPAAAPTPDITNAYQTVQARLTENAAHLTIVPSPTQAATATTAATTPAPTKSGPLPTPSKAAPQPTQAPVCDAATFGADVTIPDGTKVTPGQGFTKTWRLVNSGTCPWSTDYTIALFSGEAMGAPAQVRLPSSVAPGSSVDVSVDFVAPQAGGTYRSYWKLRNAAGAWFGIGSGTGQPFYVEVAVAGTAVATTSITPVVTGTETGNPDVLVNTTASMTPGQGINLDTGAVNSNAAGDLLYKKKNNGDLQLVPLGNFTFGIASGAPPTYAQCSKAALGAGPLTLKQDISGGSFLCYRTGQGLFGYIRLQTLDEGNNDTLQFELLTWSQP